MIVHPGLTGRDLYYTLGISPENLENYRVFAKERLGFEFKDITLLVVALTHRSYVNEHRRISNPLEHNERLEYLGDAILEYVVSDFLVRNYNEPEGTMTGWRSALVCTKSIGESGEELGYGPLVRLSHGEQRGTSRARGSIMADCFEAVIGAIYLDQGLKAAKDFIYKWIIVKIDDIIENESWRDPKSYVQEFCQKYDDGLTPVYRTLKQTGPDHNRTFTVGLFVMGHMLGIGVGHSKQDAQSEAATKAIRYYKERIAHDEEVAEYHRELFKSEQAKAARLGHHVI